VSQARRLLTFIVVQPCHKQPKSGINIKGVNCQANPQMSSTEKTSACSSFKVPTVKRYSAKCCVVHDGAQRDVDALVTGQTMTVRSQRPLLAQSQTTCPAAHRIGGSSGRNLSRPAGAAMQGQRTVGTPCPGAGRGELATLPMSLRASSAQAALQHAHLATPHRSVEHSWRIAALQLCSDCPRCCCLLMHRVACLSHIR
jgi:hypothetical protein